MKRVLRLLMAAIALLAIGALTRVPFTPGTSDLALLRLSWRTRGEAAQECRNRTSAELEALPAHMRAPQICSGRVANYRLAVRIDDGPVRTRELRAAGARADRPIYVLWQDSLTPGRHEIEIEFYSMLHPDAPRLRLKRKVEVRQGDIVLVTYDDEEGDLFLREREHEDDTHERDD